MSDTARQGLRTPSSSSTMISADATTVRTLLILATCAPSTTMNVLVSCAVMYVCGCVCVSVRE
eukprot:44404-Eustigmatos_ZCMA.PRE.1